MPTDGKGDVSRGEKLAELEGIRELEVEADAARKRLRELLADADVDVRAEAAAAAWHYHDAPEVVERLLGLSMGDASEAVRVKATSALGRVVYEGDISGAEEPDYKPDLALGEPTVDLFRRVRDHLLALARDDKRSLDERRFALEGLGFLGTDAAVSALIERFHGMRERAARLSAVFAMGRSGSRRFEPQVLAALDGDDAQLRLQAIWAAGEAELPGAVARLSKLAVDGKNDERKAAVESLGRIGGDVAAKTLLRCAENDASPEVREAATLALEEVAMGHSADRAGE